MHSFAVKRAAWLLVSSLVVTLAMHCGGSDALSTFPEETPHDGATADDGTSSANDAAGAASDGTTSANDASTANDGGIDDAATTKDAVADAAPVVRDAGYITDGGFIVTNRAVGVVCPEFLFDGGGTELFCASPATRCCINVGSSACTSAAASCGIRLECDGPEDCDGGCKLADNTTTCGTGRAVRDLCHETSQCTSGQVCCQKKIVLDDGGYAPPPTPGDRGYKGYTYGLCLLTNGGGTDDTVSDAWRCDWP